jgi:hypothetical protein
MPRAGDILSEQDLSLSVKGPDGSNTLFITTGLMRCGFSQYDTTGAPGGPLIETFSATLSSPTLAPGQFRRAIATASLAWVDGSFQGSTLGTGFAQVWGIQSVEAHLDDELGRIELQVDLRVGGTYGYAELYAIGFQVVITAAM